MRSTCPRKLMEKIRGLHHGTHQHFDIRWGGEGEEKPGKKTKRREGEQNKGDRKKMFQGGARDYSSIQGHIVLIELVKGIQIQRRKVPLQWYNHENSCLFLFFIKWLRYRKSFCVKLLIHLETEGKTTLHNYLDRNNYYVKSPVKIIKYCKFILQSKKLHFHI